jgi:hypothetical protein
LAPSCYEDSPENFDELIELLLRHGYAFYSIPRLRPLPATAVELKRSIPEGASINVMVVSKRSEGFRAGAA